MAKHKAPTQVTLVTGEERQGFARWIERSWKPAAALGVLVAVSILVLQYVRAQEEAAERKSWEALSAAAQDRFVARGLSPATEARLEERRSRQVYYAAPMGEPEALRPVVEADPDGVAAPWALASLAFSSAREDRYGEALQALKELRTRHPSNLLAEARFRFGEDATPRTLVEQATRNVQDWETWKMDHPELFQNPELPEGAPQVRIRTDDGSFLVGLYPDRAPLHVENFLRLCREGYYGGTLFHRVVAGFMIQGGDPNSRDPDPSTWGQGGPEQGIPAEPNELRHFEGVLAAAKSDPQGDSSGSQFYVTVAPAHNLDADYTVFGKVLEGMDLVQKIARGEIAEGTQDRPRDPVHILGTDIL